MIPEDPRMTSGDLRASDGLFANINLHPSIIGKKVTRNILLDAFRNFNCDFTKSKTTRTSCDDQVRQIAGKVDKYSRMIFPFIFITFNIAYWSIYLKVSGKI